MVQKDRPKTISKHYYDYQIKGVLYIDGRKVLYLKPGVKNKFYPEDIGVPSVYALEPHINQDLINYQSWENFYKQIMGVDDYGNEE